MSAWHNGEMASFDLETTGVDVENDRIVTGSLVWIRPGRGAEVRTEIVDPGIPIPAAAAAVHGITTEYAQENGLPPKMFLAAYGDALVDCFQRRVPVVGMNAAFDFTILDRELRRHGMPTIVAQLAGRQMAPIVDVAVLDKELSHRRGSRKLLDLCLYYNVKIEKAHDSGHDALAAARVAWRIAERNPSIALMSPLALHEQQVHWRKSQCDSLRRYFDSKGIKHDGVPGDWPMRPFVDHEQPVLL